MLIIKILNDNMSFTFQIEIQIVIIYITDYCQKDPGLLRTSLHCDQKLEVPSEAQ